MESSGTSGNTSEPPSSRWPVIMGTIIAVLTFALPLGVIAYYSNSDSITPALPQTIYSLPRNRN
jgi:hypothetical protein